MTAIDSTFLIDLEISDSPRHEEAMALFNQWKNEKHSILAIHNQSFLEFQHVVTDSKRFEKPLTMKQAVERCWFWIDQERVKIIYPDDNSLKRGQLWMSMYNLGRKRIQDTHMAAAFASAGVDKLITANSADFEILDFFELISY